MVRQPRPQHSVPADGLCRSKRSTAHDYDAAIEKARTDMDGNMNTAKILGFSPTHTAARWAASSPSDYDEQRFLPSAGQLYIMWLNRTAINAIIQQHTDAGEEGFFLLPDIKPGTTGQWTQPNGRWEYWWSSSVYDSHCSWVVYYDGLVNHSPETSLTTCGRCRLFILNIKPFPFLL